MGDGTLLVSIPKGGTHLVVSALVRCGYVEYGAGLIRKAEDRRALCANFFATDRFRALQDTYSYVTPEKLLWFIALETGARVTPVTSRMYMQANPLQDVPGLASALARLRNDELFPPGVVLSVHELWHDEYQHEFLNDWIETGSPRVVFNYRDPRDQLVSMMHYLRDSPVAGALGRVYAPILRSLPSEEAQISYAIGCPTFPYRNVYKTNAWMLSHPQILKLRFEDLVGAAGGGTAAAQRDAFERLTAFLGVSTDVETMASGLRAGTRTFRKGQAGGWRDVFTEAHCRAFEREFGETLAMYGYH